MFFFKKMKSMAFLAMLHFSSLINLIKQDACYTGITRDAGADSFIPTVYALPIDKTILANGIV